MYLIIGFVLFSLVSYYREGYDINFVKYMVIVLDSLSSTLAGLQDIFVLPDSQGWNRLDPHLIITQLFPISGLGFLNSTQIYKEFSVIVLGDISSGIALSSSGILESTILDVDFNFFHLLILFTVNAFFNSIFSKQSKSILKFYRNCYASRIFIFNKGRIDFANCIYY